MNPHRRLEESQLPRTGLKLVAGIVLGIFTVLFLAGWAWKLYIAGL